MTTGSGILLLGKNGQLGWELQRTLAPLGNVTAIDYDEVDFSDAVKLRQAVRSFAPQIIVNAAAYTDVDRAEAEKDRCFAINSAAPAILAEEAKQRGAVFIHYSTDYVFDGTKGAPYVEADKPNPLNVYGASKFSGEQAVSSVDGAYLILRTAWVYSRRGQNNFVNKVLEWSQQKPVLRIVDDQISNPTWARFLAETTALVLMGARSKPTGWLAERQGLYHLAGGGHASRYDWASAILELSREPSGKSKPELQRASTSEYPTPARRPLFSALDSSRFAETFGLRVVEWRDALRLSLQDH